MDHATSGGAVHDFLLYIAVPVKFAPHAINLEDLKGGQCAPSKMRSSGVGQLPRYSAVDNFTSYQAVLSRPDGRYLTARDAALKVREIQMTRAEERRILERGSLDLVAGGEIAARPVSSLWRRLLMRSAPT